MPMETVMNPLKALPLLPLVLALGCGGGGSNGSGTPAKGSLTLVLGSDSQNDWSQIVVGVEKVEISTNGSSWSTLATPQATRDLMSLRNGVETPLADKAPLASGTYSVRLTWATVNFNDPTRSAAYVVPTVGTVGANLTMPPTTTFQGSIQVNSSQESVGFLMVDAGRAVQSFPKAGGGNEILFLPHPELVPAATSGDIRGRVMSDGLVGANQEVLAEILTGALTPLVKRRTLTDANGNFVLRALPLSQGGVTFQYYLVCMPTGPTATTAFPAKGLGPLAPMVGDGLNGQDFVFASGSSVETGALQLTLTPASPRGIVTYADLRQSLQTGAGATILVVREGQVATGTTEDQRLFNGLPIGLPYGANATRLSTPILTTSAPGASSVISGATSSAALSFP